MQAATLPLPSQSGGALLVFYGGLPYLPTCSARACVTQRVTANAPGKLPQPRVELVDVAFAPPRDLPVGRDAELIEHPLDDGPDADDQLEIVRRAGRIEQRRGRVTLDVDDDLPVARDFRTRIGDICKQPAAIVGERAKLRKLGVRQRLGGGRHLGGARLLDGGR